MYILELWRGWLFETRVCSAKSGLLSSYVGHLGKLNYVWQENTEVSRSEPGGQASLISWQSYLVFLSIFRKSQASSPFEALNSAHLTKCQRDVRRSVQNSLKTMAFSRVSTGDSDIPSSCEMKKEPAFNHLSHCR